MPIILPYEKGLDNKEGAFITPLGEIFDVETNHEDFAKEYCLGEKFNSINDISSPQELLKIFPASRLTKEQLKLYKLWILSGNNKKSFCDFMVFFLHYDKLESMIRKQITTTSKEPHIRFYNYYLMNWKIDALSGIAYNDQKKMFEINYDDFSNINFADREAEKEITEIKSKVRIHERPLFFK